MPRIPSTAFEDYLQMGDERSYRLLAERYGCAKRSVVARAARERWQERLQQIQAQARDAALVKFGEDEATVRERHLKTSRAIQARALETLRTKPFDSASEATKALLLAQREERELLHLGPNANAKHHGAPTLQIERKIREVSERRIVTGAAPES